MSEKNNNVQGLVLFHKSHKVVEKKSEAVSYEDVDQENKIKIISELAPFASYFRYSILMVNESKAPISEIKVKVKYPSFLLLNRLTPLKLEFTITETDDAAVNQINFRFDELSELNRKQINLYFTPTELEREGTLSSYITYVNNKDYVRVINSEPLEIELRALTIQEKIVPNVQISSLLQDPNVKKGTRSIGIPIKKREDLNLFLKYVREILEEHHLRFIATDEDKRIAWYYGQELDRNEDILVIGRIVSNKVEISAASKNHFALIALLTNIVNAFIKRISSIGLVDKVSHVYDLECKRCGNILRIFPQKGESIICEKCNLEQTVW